MNKKNILLLILLIHATHTVIAEDKCLDDDFYNTLRPTIEQIQIVGYALAVLMIGYQGLKWSSSDSDQAREDAKKGIIYVIIGIFLLKVGGDFILYVICG